MLRLLDDLVLLKEVDDVEGYSSMALRQKYPEQIVIIRHIAFIKKEVLDDKLLANLTDLSEYVQLGELANILCIQKTILIKKIYFMKDTKRHGEGISLFEYIELKDIYFIKLNKKMKNNFLKYQPFVARYDDAKNMVCGCMLGDIKIGFY